MNTHEYHHWLFLLKNYIMHHFFILDALPAAILLVFNNVPNLVSIMFDIANLHKIKYIHNNDSKN